MGELEDLLVYKHNSLLADIANKINPQFVKDMGICLDSFNSITNWSGTSGTIATNAATSISGGASLHCIAPSAGTPFQSTETVSFTIPQGSLIGLWVYITDYTQTSNVTIYLSSNTGVTKYFMKQWNTKLHNGWNLLAAYTSEFTNQNGEDWANTFIRLKVYIGSVAAKISDVYLDSLVYGIKTTPTVVVTFDDAYDFVINNAFPYMLAKGIPGTVYVPSSLVNTAGFMTRNQLKTLACNGWDICNHTASHVDLTTLTIDQVKTEIQTCDNWLIANGFTPGHVAYPTGTFNQTVLDAMAQIGMKSGRNTARTTQFMGDPRILNAYSVQNTDSVDAVKGFIDAAIQSGFSCILAFHKIVPAAAASIEYSIANFQAVMDYIKSTGAKTITISQWAKGWAY